MQINKKKKKKTIFELSFHSKMVGKYKFKPQIKVLWQGRKPALEKHP